MYKQELYGEHYVWLLPGSYSENWWRTSENDSDCTASQLEEALTGYIATEILPISSSEESGISGIVSTSVYRIQHCLFLLAELKYMARHENSLSYIKKNVMPDLHEIRITKS